MNAFEIGLLVFTFVIVAITLAIQIFKLVKYKNSNGSIADIMAMFNQVMPNVITVFEEYLEFKNNDNIDYDDALNYVTVNLIGVLDKFEMSASMKNLITHDNIKTLVDPILGKLWDDFYVEVESFVDETTDGEEV